MKRLLRTQGKPQGGLDSPKKQESGGEAKQNVCEGKAKGGFWAEMQYK